MQLRNDGGLTVASVFHDVARGSDRPPPAADPAPSTRATTTLPLEQVRVMEASIDHLTRQVADLASRLQKAELRASQIEARERLAKEDLIVTRSRLAAMDAHANGLARELDDMVKRVQHAGG